MKHAALGVRMHSGWGVLVTVSGDSNSLEVLERRRIAITDPAAPGANQPYHYAASLALPEAERHLANCASISERLALAAVEEVVRELDGRHYRIVGSAVLLASGRVLPPLAKILAAHPLIHTAEGAFFRHAVSRACERLELPVTSICERDLEQQAKTAFGTGASQVQRTISAWGSSIGPPWTKDHKTAAVAAAIVLARQ
jgi:hypothetical protein